MMTGYGDAGGMNLGEARIAEEGTPFVSAIGRGDVAAARVGRKKENIAVTPGRENYGVAREGLDLPRTKIAGDDALGIDRKSTRLNSSHLGISYAVFCLKKKNKLS